MNYLVLLIFTMVNHFTIFDFNTNTNPRDWKIVDDGVMGGISKSIITLDQDGNGIFEGHVSLENNGGFSSVRHQFKTVDVSKSQRFILRIQGDGKSYQFRVKSQLNEYYSYKFDFRTNNSLCYNCLFPRNDEEQNLKCSDHGVFSPLVGLVGSIQAGEVIKVLLNIGTTLHGKLLLINHRDIDFKSLKIQKDKNCEICS